jgi:hypothetical protein
MWAVPDSALAPNGISGMGQNRRRIRFIRGLTTPVNSGSVVQGAPAIALQIGPELFRPGLR